MEPPNMILDMIQILFLESDFFVFRGVTTTFEIIISILHC